MSITLKSVTVTLIGYCPQFKNHFINECALIYYIYIYIYVHITVKKKKIIQLQQAIESCCLFLTMSNAEFCDVFFLTSPSPGLTL